MKANFSFNKTGDMTPYSIKSIGRSVMSIVFIISSFAGNMLVLYAVYRFRRLRTISNMIIANLSLADVLFSIFVAPINVFFWSQADILVPSMIPCYVSGVGAFLFGLSSIYTLVFISFERYLATGSPIRYRSFFGVKAVKIGLAVIWIWSATLCGFTFILSRYTYIESFYHCIPDWSGSLTLTLTVIVLANILPLAILVYSNIHVLRAVLYRRNRVQEILKHRLPRTAEPSNKNQREKRVSLIIIAVIIVFILCWTPYAIAMICLAVERCSLPREFMSAAVVLTIANGSMNPIIYGVMNINFRAAFAAILGCTKRTEERSCVVKLVVHDKNASIISA